MSKNDDYEFISRDSLNQLHSEIKNLKTDGTQDVVNHDEELHKSIKSLTSTLKGLIDVFHDASLEMKLEDNENQVLKKRLDPIESKVDVLIEQNKKIAQGLIAITEAVQAKFDEIENAMGLTQNGPQDLNQNQGQYDQMQNNQMPDGQMEQMGGVPPSNNFDMPPLPPEQPNGMPQGSPQFNDGGQNLPQGGMSMPPDMEPHNDDQLKNTFGSYSQKQH